MHCGCAKEHWPTIFIVQHSAGGGVMFFFLRFGADLSAEQVPGAKTMGMRTVWLYEKESVRPSLGDRPRLGRKPSARYEPREVWCAGADSS